MHAVEGDRKVGQLGKACANMQHCLSSRGETAEIQRWEEFRAMRAKVHVEKKEDALRTAREWTEEDQENTVWTDGSRLENGAVGAAVAFKKGGGWNKEGTYLGKNGEVFDAEVWAIGRALEVLNERNEEGKEYSLLRRSGSNQQGPTRSDRTRPGTGSQSHHGRDIHPEERKRRNPKMDPISRGH